MSFIHWSVPCDSESLNVYNCTESPENNKFIVRWMVYARRRFIKMITKSSGMLERPANLYRSIFCSVISTRLFSLFSRRHWFVVVGILVFHHFWNASIASTYFTWRIGRNRNGHWIIGDKEEANVRAMVWHIHSTMCLGHCNHSWHISIRLLHNCQSIADVHERNSSLRHQTGTLSLNLIIS